MATSNTNLKKMAEVADRLKGQLGRYKEQAQATLGVVVQTSEIGIAAFGFGVIRGKFPEPALFGVPVDLAAGLGMHILGFFGGAGNYTEHAHNFGDGALASYLSALGTGLGKQWGAPAAQKQIAGAPVATQGMPQMGTGAVPMGVSQQQLDAAYAWLGKLT
jgi:hypothetical protein